MPWMLRLVSVARRSAGSRWAGRAIRIVVFGALSSIWMGAAVALPIIDQSNVAFFPTGFVNFSINSSNAPMGQEFVPQLDGVDSVQLIICCSARESLFIRIRDGSIQGPVLGTSALLPPHSDLLATFHFDASIALTPGDLYVIEIVNPTTFGESQLGVGDPFAMPQSAYGPGRWIVAGQPDTHGGDIWFQEGLGIPEPSTATLIGIGLSALAPVVRKRRGELERSATGRADTGS